MAKCQLDIGGKRTTVQITSVQRVRHTLELERPPLQWMVQMIIQTFNWVRYVCCILAQPLTRVRLQAVIFSAPLDSPEEDSARRGIKRAFSGTMLFNIAISTYLLLGAPEYDVRKAEPASQPQERETGISFTGNRMLHIFCKSHAPCSTFQISFSSW